MGIKSTVKGTIIPLGNKIFVTDLEFGEQKTTSGIIIPGDDGKIEGIKPRWARVWAVGPNQKDVVVGEWILIEHGRWTRKIEIEMDDGDIIRIHSVDPECILMSSDDRPEGANLMKRDMPVSTAPASIG
jgi:co-chaperonin GroES (HSP10)